MRRAIALATLFALAVGGIAATTSAGAGSPAKPVIAKPVTVPAQPFAGKRFTALFKVTRSDTRGPLTTGRMVCDPSIFGKVIAHAESFRAGTARLSFVVPPNAAGKVLKVRLTIKSSGGSSTRVSGFRVGQSVKPSLSVTDVSVAEGNSGTTAFTFPLTLSGASTQTISVTYATADGTATAGSDYVAANGTLTFKPGETAKTINVTVNGDMVVEPDETLTVRLSNPVNATVARPSARGTITNDDRAPRSGHYTGTTSQGKGISFDVAADLTGLSNLTATIDQSCNLPGLDMTDLTFPLDSAPIAPDWNFGVNLPLSTSDISLNVTFSGKLSLPGNASGTLRVDMSMYNLPIFGTVTCSTGDVTWNAS